MTDCKKEHSTFHRFIMLLDYSNLCLQTGNFKISNWRRLHVLLAIWYEYWELSWQNKKNPSTSNNRNVDITDFLFGYSQFVHRIYMLFVLIAVLRNFLRTTLHIGLAKTV